MTERTWIDVLADEHVSTAATERINAGFRVLARTCTAWPTPHDLISVLPPPPREYFQALPRPEITPEQQATEHAARVLHMQHIRDILAPILDGARKTP